MPKGLLPLLPFISHGIGPALPPHSDGASPRRLLPICVCCIQCGLARRTAISSPPSPRRWRRVQLWFPSSRLYRPLAMLSPSKMFFFWDESYLQKNGAFFVLPPLYIIHIYFVHANSDIPKKMFVCLFACFLSGEKNEENHFPVKASFYPLSLICLLY